jgi:Fic family protein
MSDEPITVINMEIPHQNADEQAGDKRNGAHEMRQESRAQRRSRERAHKEIMTSREMHKEIAHRKASRQNLTHGERPAQQQRSNSNFASKHTTPQAKLSDVATSCTPNNVVNTVTPESASVCTPAYSIGTEGNSHILFTSPCPYALCPCLP